MRLVKWILGLALLAVYAGLLHYSLPSRDVVRVVDTDVVRIDASPEGAGATDAERVTRDQMRISTITPDGAERVYRNEDTDWSFPWYFKFDSADLQARAQDLKSTAENPKWVVVTHYGWRLTFQSWFPNAIAMERVESPDVDLTPWFNIVFVTVLTLAIITVLRLLQAAFRRHVDPVIDELDERRGALARFWASLFAK